MSMAVLWCKLLLRCRQSHVLVVDFDHSIDIVDVLVAFVGVYPNISIEIEALFESLFAVICCAGRCSILSLGGVGSQARLGGLALGIPAEWMILSAIHLAWCSRMSL